MFWPFGYQRTGIEYASRLSRLSPRKPAAGIALGALDSSCGKWKGGFGIAG